MAELLLTGNTFIQRIFPGNSILAAGSSVVDGLASNSVNIAPYEGVLFIGHIVQGGTGGAATLSVRQTTAGIAALTSGGQGTALLLTSATVAAVSSATGESMVVDVYKPRQGYGSFLHAQWVVASSCATPGPIFALAYQADVSAGIGVTLSALTIPQTSAASSFAASAPPSTFTGITGGVVRAVSPST